jgi:hypothetical protein
MHKFSLSAVKKIQTATNEPDADWTNLITYCHAPEFVSSHDKQSSEENLRTIRNEIRLQKELFQNLTLSPANKEALSHAVIRFVPLRPDAPNAPSAIIHDDTGVLSFALVSLLTEKERYQTLVHELAHLTIRYINKQQVKSDVSVPGKRLSYPFLNEHGEIDLELKKQFREAVEENKQKIEHLKNILLKTPASRTEQENNEISFLSDYVPQIYRTTMPKVLFLLSLSKGLLTRVEDDKLYLPDIEDTGAYGQVIDDYEGEITIVYSFNKNNTPEELAKSYIKDYEGKCQLLAGSYPEEFRKRGSTYDENDSLMESGAFIEELLRTPKLRQAFAPRYYEYINQYSEKRMAYPAAEFNRLTV